MEHRGQEHLLRGAVRGELWGGTGPGTASLSPLRLCFPLFASALPATWLPDLLAQQLSGEPLVGCRRGSPRPSPQPLTSALQPPDVPRKAGTSEMVVSKCPCWVPSLPRLSPLSQEHSFLKSRVLSLRLPCAAQWADSGGLVPDGERQGTLLHTSQSRQLHPERGHS